MVMKRENIEKTVDIFGNSLNTTWVFCKRLLVLRTENSDKYNSIIDMLESKNFNTCTCEILLFFVEADESLLV